MIHKKAYNTFNDSEIVGSYIETVELQKSEQNIYEKYKDKIKNSVFLDLGIGTGRTTLFFQPLCARYIGVDFSPNMVYDAQKKVQNKNELVVGDARDLSFISKESIDVVLYSFNGLDYVNYEDRIKILEQIYTVLKPGGLFIFSTHNIKSFKKIFSFNLDGSITGFKSLKFIIIKLFFFFKILLYNNFKLIYLLFKSDYVILNDGVYNFSLKTMYVNLKKQKIDLQKKGFKDIQLYSKLNGIEMSVNQISNNNEPWIYYTCFK